MADVINYDKLAAALLRASGTGDCAGLVEAVTRMGLCDDRHSGPTESVVSGAASPAVVDGSGSAGGSCGSELSGERCEVEVPVVKFVSADSEQGFYPSKVDGASGVDVVSVSTDGGSQGSVEFVGAPVVGDGVRQVKFGGLADSCETVGEVAPRGSGFFKLARSPAALDFRDRIATLAAARMPKVAQGDIAICMYSVRAMPAVMDRGKDRLRMLATLGDAAITMYIVGSVASKSGNVEDAKEARFKVMADAALADIFRTVGLSACVSSELGVGVLSDITGATAFKAVVGVISLYRSFEVVTGFLQCCQVLSRM